MPSFLSLGEIMVELAPADAGLLRKGFAGDTFNTAWYVRRLLSPDWSVSYGTVIGKDAVSDDMARFIEGEDIATDALGRHDARTVGLYLISLQNGERSFSYWRGQSAAKTLADDADWLEKTLANRANIHFSGITLAILAPEARERLCAALARARAALREPTDAAGFAARMADFLLAGTAAGTGPDEPQADQPQASHPKGATA